VKPQLDPNFKRRTFRLFKWKDDIQSKKLPTDFGTKRAIKLKRMKGDLQLERCGFGLS